jgi:hypothetical protein
VRLQIVSIDCCDPVGGEITGAETDAAGIVFAIIAGLRARRHWTFVMVAFEFWQVME